MTRKPKPLQKLHQPHLGYGHIRGDSPFFWQNLNPARASWMAARDLRNSLRIAMRSNFAKSAKKRKSQAADRLVADIGQKMGG